MKKLGMTALLLAGLSQATGCIIVSDDSSGAVIQVDWDLREHATSVTCSSKNAETVRITARDSFGSPTTITTACGDLSAQFAPMPLDSYTVDVELLDGTGATISDTITLNADLTQDGQTVIVGPALFDFTRYDVEFYVDYGTNTADCVPATGDSCNCTETLVNGSGVIQQTLNLVVTGDTTCSNYTVQFANAADGTGDTCGSVELCQENTAVQTIISVPPGSYDLTVDGWKGATDGTPVRCYSGAANFTLPHDQSYQIFSLSSDIQAPFLLDAPASCNATKR